MRSSDYYARLHATESEAGRAHDVSGTPWNTRYRAALQHNGLCLVDGSAPFRYPEPVMAPQPYGSVDAWPLDAWVDVLPPHAKPRVANAMVITIAVGVVVFIAVGAWLGVIKW